MKFLAGLGFASPIQEAISKDPYSFAFTGLLDELKQYTYVHQYAICKILKNLNVTVDPVNSVKLIE